MEKQMGRIEPRYRAASRVDWCVEGTVTHIVSELGNVGPGGAFVRTRLPAPVGAKLAMHVLTDIGAVAVEGKVAWSSATGMGIAFDG
jgi:hypothetical protein